MAIQKSLAANYGYDFSDGYLKIDGILIKIFDDEVEIDLRGYANQAAREKQKEYDEKRLKLDTLRRDPKSEEIDILILEKELGDRPIGIYREKVELSFTDFEPFIEGNTRDDIIKAGYLYIKTLKKYADGIDV